MIILGYNNKINTILKWEDIKNATYFTTSKAWSGHWTLSIFMISSSLVSTKPSVSHAGYGASIDQMNTPTENKAQSKYTVRMILQLQVVLLQVLQMCHEKSSNKLNIVKNISSHSCLRVSSWIKVVYHKYRQITKRFNSRTDLNVPIMIVFVNTQYSKLFWKLNLERTG